MSVKLDNGCHIMLDEGRTEQAGSDFSADATDMDFWSMHCMLHFLHGKQSFGDFLSTKLLFVNELERNKPSLVVHKMK